ncbi:MAG: GldG family protein [bacterium]|nr:GldG family protein [bacterium]
MRSQFVRRLTYGSNVALAVVLAAALVVMVNWLANKYPRRHDFIQTSDLYQLSEKTKNVLKELRQDVEFYYFSNPQESELYSKIERLLKAYQAETPHVKVRLADTIRDIAELRKLVRELSVDEPDTVVIKYGEGKKVLTEMKLADFRFLHDDYTGGQIKKLKTLKAEQAFTSAILELMNPVKIQARFTVHHGEKSTQSYGDDGYSEARRYLERDGISVSPIELVGLQEVSGTNCDVLIIAGPTKRFMDYEINLIRRYLNQGGRAVIALDPEMETGIEELVSEYNVKVGKDIVVDPELQLPYASPLQLIAARYSGHPITRRLQTYTTFFLARSVSVADYQNEVNRAEELVTTTRRGWGETETEKDTFKFNEGEDVEGPVSVGVAVENKKTGMRMVVVGDADFFTNREIGNGANRDLFLNMVNWAMKREYLVAIGAKTVKEMRRLDLNALQLWAVTIMVMVVVPLLAVLAGIVVYLRRRQ